MGSSGQHHTGTKTSVGNAIIVVRTGWSFVNRASDAVAAEFAITRKPLARTSFSMARPISLTR